MKSWSARHVISQLNWPGQDQVLKVNETWVSLGGGVLVQLVHCCEFNPGSKIRPSSILTDSRINFGPAARNHAIRLE